MFAPGFDGSRQSALLKIPGYLADWIFKPLVTAIFVVAIGGSILAVLTPGGQAVRETVSRLLGRQAEPALQGERVLSRRLLAELGSGGFTLFVRHGTKDTIANLDAFDRASIVDPASIPTDFRRGLCLNEVGALESRLLGQFLRATKIPIGEVLSSPICRARETAIAAIGRVDRVDQLLVHAKVAANEGERSTQRTALRALMNQAPKPGVNRIIFAHWDTLDRRDFGNLSLEEAGMAVFQHAEGTVRLRAVVGLTELIRALPQPGPR